MKHYIDIQNIREENIDLGNGITRQSNCGNFKPGDHIIIQTKVDGTCSSFEYDVETGTLKAYSRKNELDAMKTNQGFWNWVQNLNAEEYKDEANYIVYGEFLIKNKVKYEPEAYKHLYVFDIWDKDTQRWMTQDFVKKFCEKHNLEYINTLYVGSFISWEHCRSFMSHHWRSLGEEEGVIVKSDYSIGNGEEDRYPAYLKLVNDSFKESMKMHIKEVDPEKEAAKTNAEELMKSIVTENRVSKMLLKLRDEGIIPSELTSKDMGTVAKYLPKRIFEDCMKEEKEVCMAAGEYAGKICSSITMSLAKKIILGE